jgi:LacI family transcriptional regulator
MFNDLRNSIGRFNRSLQMLLDWRVDGLIVIANGFLADSNLLSTLEATGIPTAIVGCALGTSHISSVSVNNETGAIAAMEHLHGLGHRNIAYIRGPKLLGDSTPRWNGITRFANEHGLNLDTKLILDLPEVWETQAIFDASTELIAGALRCKVPFSAVLAFNDISALGAMRALMKSGVKVPEECSVVGFDDIVSTTLYTPSLTTVRQPMEVMGTAVAQIVMENIEASLEEKIISVRRYELQPELIIRESTTQMRG